MEIFQSVPRIADLQLTDEEAVLLLQQLPVQQRLPVDHIGDGELCLWTCSHTCSISSAGTNP